jgi:hypothetical protein
MLMVTASQLNRGAVDEIEFDHSHISGGISKINTADNVFGIFTSRAMRERGRYQIQCMKSRSSTGVGMKVDLDYNIDTMRITDSGEDSGSNHQSTTSIMSQIKSSSRVAPAADTVTDSDTGEIVPIKADVNGSKLKSMLAGIKAKTV